MNRSFGVIAVAALVLQGCYTVLETRLPVERAPLYSSWQAPDSGFTGLPDSASALDVYRQGYQDGHYDMIRFRDEERWLRWNQWQYWGWNYRPMFWSYNDFFWDPAFYWGWSDMPSWQFNMAFYGPGFGIGLGNWGMGGPMGWGWGGPGPGWGWNNPGWGCWNCGPVIVIPGNTVAERRNRTPRGSGRTGGQAELTTGTTSGDQARAPRLTVDPATFVGPSGSAGKSSGGSDGSGRKPRSSDVSGGGSSGGSSGVRSSGSSGSSGGGRGSGRSGGSSSGNSGNSGGSGRRPRGN